MNTKRSDTGIILIVNNMPITWVSKRQKPVETFKYGSELVEVKMEVELII